MQLSSSSAQACWNVPFQAKKAGLVTASGDAEVVGRTASKFLQSIKKVRVARCLALVLEVAQEVWNKCVFNPWTWIDEMTTWCDVHKSLSNAMHWSRLSLSDFAVFSLRRKDRSRLMRRKKKDRTLVLTKRCLLQYFQEERTSARCASANIVVYQVCS